SLQVCSLQRFNKISRSTLVFGIDDLRLGEMPHFGAEHHCLAAVVRPLSTKLPRLFSHLIPCRTRESPQLSRFVLKRFLSIFSNLIFDSSVDRGMPNLAAAPVGPNTRPRLAFRASSIMFFSCSSSLRGSSIWFFGFAVRNACGCCGNQLSSIEKVSVSQRITERSMTFCSSRMFPGQAYD